MTTKPNYSPNTTFERVKVNQSLIRGITSFFVKTVVLTFLICFCNNFALAKKSNNPPIANDDSYSGLAARGQSAPGVLANDTDPDGNTLYLREIVSFPSNGTVTINTYGQGSFNYQPNSGYIGNDSFTYRVCDSPTGGLCDTATVTLNQPNRPPTANPDTFYNLEARGQNSVNFLTDDSDPDGDIFNFSRIVTNTSHGILNPKIFGQGRFMYSPNQGYLGNDSFTYEICDIYGACSIGTVTLIEANRAPIAISDFFGSNCNNGSGICIG